MMGMFNNGINSKSWYKKIKKGDLKW
jgi:hypothetical protein